MKKFMSICLLLLGSGLMFSQEWQTDFEKAKQLASQENKAIILVFQGSDWCAPCIRLDKEIWSTKEFRQYAKQHYIMLQADFPRRRKNALSSQQQAHNNQLAEIYNKNGHFPLVVVLDKDGKVLGRIGYKKIPPKAYIDILDSYLPQKKKRLIPK